MFFKKLIPFLIFMYAFLASYGQEGELQYYQNGFYIKQYSEITGLVYNYCKNVFEDSRGFLWIATVKGLSRFDGNQFVNYGIKEGLPGANITQIEEDSLGFIYVATTEGIARFTGYNQTTKSYFHVYPQTVHRKLPLEGAVAVDSNTIIFQETDGSTHLLQKNSTRLLFNSSSAAGSLIHRKKYDYYYIYISDTLKVFDRNFNLVNSIYLHDSGYTAHLMDGAGRMQTYYRGDKRIIDGAAVIRRSVVPDSIIWFASLDNEDKMFYFKQGSVFYYNNHESSKVLDLKRISFKSNGIARVRDGSVWVTTDGGGLFRITPLSYESNSKKTREYFFYNKNGKKFIETTTDLPGVFPPDNTSNRLKQKAGTIFRDRNGIVWFCTMNGIYKREPGKAAIHYRFPGNSEYWNDYASAILDADEAPNGDIWFYGYCGAIMYRNGKFEHYTNRNGITLGRVKQLAIDKSGSVLLVDFTNKLLYVSGDTLLPFTDLSQIPQFSPDKLRADGLGFIWVESNKKIYKIEKQPSGKYGITDSILNFTSSIENEITAFGFDMKGNCWVGYTGGTVQVYFINDDGHYDLYNTVTYTVDDGLTPMMKSRYSLWCDNNNRMMLVHDQYGETRLFAFSTTDAIRRKNMPLPQLSITGMLINYNEPDWLSMGYEPGPLGLPVTCKLRAKDNNIVFNYHGVSLSNPSNIIYEVMLKGYDVDWHTTSSTVANYTNLPPGNYTFLVKASNVNGSWTNIHSYTFTILPPWFKTAWAIAVWIVLALFAIFFIHFIRLHSIRMTHLKESSQFKSSVIGLIGHDMVTPLLYIAKVSLQLRNYNDKLSRKTTMESLSEINTTATNLHFFGESIVHWIRTQSKNFRPIMEEFDIDKAIKELADFHKPLVAEKGNELSYESGSNMHGYQDLTLIRIILHNLLLNANKFTSHGVISISAFLENNILSIKVKDTGKGMDQERVDALNNFNPILSSPGTHKEKGWGMGYKIITDLLKFTGGKLHVASQLGKGTEILVQLPCKQKPLTEKLSAGFPGTIREYKN